MNKKNKTTKATNFQAYLDDKLKDKVLKRHYDEYGKQLEIAYQIIKLRKKAKMSQLELAKKIHTTQSNVARIESGQQNFTVNLLNKVAKALGSELKICIG